MKPLKNETNRKRYLTNKLRAERMGIGIEAYKMANTFDFFCS